MRNKRISKTRSATCLMQKKKKKKKEKKKKKKKSLKWMKKVDLIKGISGKMT